MKKVYNRKRGRYKDVDHVQENTRTLFIQKLFMYSFN